MRGKVRKLALSALLVGATGALSACVVTGDQYGDRDDGYYGDDRYGYPPSTPRHGYRHSYGSGLTLIFNSGLGLYSVYGYPDYYFHDGFFYRWHSGYWNRSRHWNQRWQRCESRYWPRQIHHVHNNYYVHGSRPRHDWDGDRHDRDGREHRDDRDRDHHGSPTPGGPPHDQADANGDGNRERGERHMDRQRREEESREERSEQARAPRDERAEPRRGHDRDGQEHADAGPPGWRASGHNEELAQRAQREQQQREANARRGERHERDDSQVAARRDADRAMREQNARAQAERAAVEQAAREQARSAETQERRSDDAAQQQNQGEGHRERAPDDHDDRRSRGRSWER